MLRSLLAVIVTIAAFAADAEARGSNVTISLDDAHRREIDQAYGYLNSGHPEQAEPLLAQVIAAYDKAYAGREVRCAQDTEDAVRVGLFGVIGSSAEIADAAKTMKRNETRIVPDKVRDLTVVGPGFCQAIFGRGFALIDLQRSDEAEPLLARAVALAPTRAHYLNEYAEFFKSRRDWQRAYDLFARASDIAKTGPDASQKQVLARSLRGMGFTKIELGDLDTAERMFKQSIEIEDNPGAHSELEYIARKKAIGAGT